jgi:two-component system sensor histidine kinase UhpB
MASCRYRIQRSRTVVPLPAGETLDPAPVPAAPAALATAPVPDAGYLDEIESFVNLGRWEWTVATGALSCSQQLLRIYGVASQDMMPTATSFLLHTHPSDRMRVRASIMRAVQTSSPFQFQQRIVRPGTHEERVLRTRGRAETDEAGKPVRILGVSQDITDAHVAERQAQDRLKRAARSTLDREEQDRSRIALRIREDVAEPLLALGRKLAAASGPTADTEAAPLDLAECISTATAVGTNTLRIIGSLQPAFMEQHGLLAALRSEALRIGRVAAIPVNVSGEEVSPRLPLGVESALFRVAQEALLNASRHSGCTLIAVSLTRSAGKVRLEVRDNGCGMDANATAADRSPEKRGLTLMRERAEAISATFRLSSRPGAGTRVIVEYAN